MLKQGGQQVDEFLTAFDNLKIDAGLSNDFALHLLLQNVSLSLLKQAILKRGEPFSYNDLQPNIQEVGRAAEYIWTAHNTINPYTPRAGPGPGACPAISQPADTMDIDC